MTSKQEALELVDRFRENSKKQIFYGWDFYHKQCAIIAVDEMICEFKKIDPESISDLVTGLVEYWNEVKTEINKL